MGHRGAGVGDREDAGLKKHHASEGRGAGFWFVMAEIALLVAVAAFYATDAFTGNTQKG